METVQRFMVGPVTIFGAATLERYTKGILVAGFEKLAAQQVTLPAGTVYQIHGSAGATADDQAIMQLIKRDLVAPKPNARTIVLLHRPDEIQDRHPQLRALLASATHDFGLAFLGDLHTTDSFYASPAAQIRVVPHGFFSAADISSQSAPIVVGTHTTWGDMRSPEHLLRLLGELFRLNEGTQPIVGYFGGKPADALSVDALSATLRRHFPDLSVRFEDAHTFDTAAVSSSEPVILVDNQDTQPEDATITFNTQLYFYGERVRTGESSGSLHMNVSIPVILEMNGSEKIEELEVIKVPYDTSTMVVSSADFSAAAQGILTMITDGSYQTALQHNYEQAQKYNNEYVARQLNEFLNSLS